MHDFRSSEIENSHISVAFQEMNSLTNRVHCIKSISL